MLGLSLWLSSGTAHAQEGMLIPDERSDAWDTATTVLTLSTVGLGLVMPRVFYADPEVTVGWKARFHVSVLAPTMTLAALTLLNEHTLKEQFKGYRPGCEEANMGVRAARTTACSRATRCCHSRCSVRGWASS